jgi:drug/metabolite transporter (DMT)-like permease
MTSALGCAPATVVAPMEFLRLPLIAVVAMLVYGEPLEVAVFAGGAVVLVANLMNVRAERRARLAPAG